MGVLETTRTHGRATARALHDPGAWRPAASATVRAAVERSPLSSCIFWRLPEGSRKVALTFDDGPDPELTPRVLEILAACKVRATFFVVGENALRHPDLIRRMVREGHCVANHTHTHARADRLSPEALLRELEQAEDALRTLEVPAGTRLFRPPFGAIHPAQAWRLARSGRRIALWSRDSRDYLGSGAEEIAGLGETAEPRDILLMHDRFPATIEALPELIERLALRGLRTGTLGEGG
jgi:peptidoglycan/xylan/chitin deacetylase (PgdA/CDA1 family)